VHISFQGGGKHLPHDTSGHFFQLERVNMIPGVFFMARVMKAIRSAPVAKLVVVIDDDPLILEATEGQFTAWMFGNSGTAAVDPPGVRSDLR
jgi:hypothetical protein